MKIMYLISARGHGKGGHFHSLNDISEAMSHYADVAIFTIGKGVSEVLLKNPYFKETIYFTGKNIFSLRKRLKRAIASFNPDIIHCFDSNTYDMLKLCCISSKAGIVVNKCGGPNPSAYPEVEELVLFSIENYNWFHRSGFRNLHLIPNRAKKVITAAGLIGYPSKDPRCFTFLRICRIGTAHKKSMVDSIELLHQLQSDKAKLIIVGVVESEAVLNELKEKSKNLNVEFITEQKYIIEASKLLYLADVVIATGRGVFEATSLGLPVLTPVKDKSIPFLIREENFESFFSTNFSQRNISEKNESEEINFIKRLLDEPNYYHNISELSSKIFQNYFDVAKGAEKYFEIYQSLKENQQKKIAYFKNFKLRMKSLKSFL